MIPSFEFCQEHPNCWIWGIYMAIDKIRFQRKVCTECIVNFQIPLEQILKKERFISLIHKKATQLELERQLKESQSNSILKRVLEKIELFQKEFTLIFSSMRNYITRIQDIFTTEDEKFERLINQNLNLFECSNKELDFLVDFLERNIFEEWMQKKNGVCQEIYKTGQILERIIQNSYKTCSLIEQINVNLTQKNKEENNIELIGFENINKKLIQTTFQLTIQKNGDRVYHKDGKILRLEKNKFGSRNVQILQNLEQTKNLQFIGQYGVQGYKIKQWNYYWKEQQIGGGMFNINGEKEGGWIELGENYWDEKKLIEVGSYQGGHRIGKWKYNLNNEAIGGGSYYELGQGKKDGFWIELSSGSDQTSQVYYMGEYKVGKKVGRWDIFYKGKFQKEFKQIGGGSYDEENEIKIGMWVELNDTLWHRSLVTFNGEYRNANKIGRWDIFWKKDSDENEFELIGGGRYGEDGEGKQIGEWIELIDWFDQFSQITYKGEYNNGIKIGKWQNFYRKQNENQFYQIGGGSYHSEGNIKIGTWSELNEGFDWLSQIIYTGEYQQGKKVGHWDILYRGYYENEFRIIGGGTYERKKGISIKIGIWCELSNGFRGTSQVTQNGEYKNGQKFGNWNIWWRQDYGSYWNERIAGGSYEFQEANSYKIGRWIELGDGFENDSQTISEGEYSKGNKIGRWNIFYRKERQRPFEEIGGGSYDQQDGNSIKIGRWIELDDEFQNNSQIIYKGDYKKGNKINRWDILYRNEEFKPFELIGGGSFELWEGNQVKCGKWIELIDGFNQVSQITYNGDYKNSQQIGRWDILYRREELKPFELIGGGSFEFWEGNYVKSGKWIEVIDGYKESRQITYEGRYNKGNKVGRWEIYYRNNKSGGGSYDEDNSMKIGNWIEINIDFDDDWQVTYSGVDDGGKKVGLWIYVDIKTGQIREQTNY